MNTVWVVTKEYNQYDQFGEYFVDAYKEKPSIKECKKILIDHKIIERYQCEEYQEKMTLHLRSGGGRIGDEDMWLYLCEVKLK